MHSRHHYPMHHSRWSPDTDVRVAGPVQCQGGEHPNVAKGIHGFVCPTIVKNLKFDTKLIPKEFSDPCFGETQ